MIFVKKYYCVKFPDKLSPISLFPNDTLLYMTYYTWEQK